MASKEEIKKMLRGHDCSKCAHRRMSDAEIEKYTIMWKSEPPEDWCSHRKQKPEISTCRRYIGEDIFYKFSESQQYYDEDIYADYQQLYEYEELI